MKPCLPVITYIQIKTVHAFRYGLLSRIVGTNVWSFPYSPLAHPNHLIALLLMVFPWRVAGQTTIVVRRTPVEVVIAADSLRTVGKRGEIVGTRLVCKIVPLGPTSAFAASGFAGTEVAEIDIKGMATKAAAQKGSIHATADTFTGMVLPPLTEGLESVRRTDIESYRKQTMTIAGIKKPPVEVAFIGVERGSPTFVTVSFWTENTEREGVKLAPKKRSSDEFSKRSSVGLFMGHHENIDGYMSNDLFWRKNGPTVAVQRLVEIMADARPDVVGRPVEVLRITKTGSKWENHDTCKGAAENPNPLPKKKQRRRA